MSMHQRSVGNPRLRMSSNASVCRHFWVTFTCTPFFTLLRPSSCTLPASRPARSSPPPDATLQGVNLCASLERNHCVERVGFREQGVEVCCRRTEIIPVSFSCSSPAASVATVTCPCPVLCLEDSKQALKRESFRVWAH